MSYLISKSRYGYAGTGSRSRASHIKDLEKRARNRTQTNQPRTFRRDDTDLFGLYPVTKTELRRYKKALGCTRAEALRHLT